MKKLAERIKYLRVSNNLTILQLSKQTGISKSAINRWENDQADIKGENLKILAKFFNVSTDFLLGVTDF